MVTMEVKYFNKKIISVINNRAMVLKKINVRGYGLGLGLFYLTPLSTIFQLYRSGHNVVSSTPSLSGVRTHNVSGDRY